MSRYLFVCVENSCRSQMAEAFARMARVDAHSAGSRPSGVVNPKAVAAMEELGYDMGQHRSKSIKEVPGGPYDAIVTMGCGDECSDIPARAYLEWAIPDPKAMTPDEFRVVRDRIAAEVEALVQPSTR